VILILSGLSYAISSATCPEHPDLLQHLLEERRKLRPEFLRIAFGVKLQKVVVFTLKNRRTPAESL
jgi:hypothetical protein